MTTHQPRILRGAQALGVALAVLAAPGTAGAVVVIPCASVGAATRPGPITGGQAAIRLMPPAGAASVDVSELTFVDAGAVEIALQVENLADGTAFLRASQDLDVGEYTLTYRPPCTIDVFDLPLTVIAAPAELTTLGELTVDYEAYCPGDAFDTSLGPIARDYPPPIRASIALSDDAARYLHFLALDFDDDQDGSWLSGVLPVSLLATPLELSRAALCGSNPTARPSLHTFTAVPRIVDGPTLPTLTAEADVTCLDCPAAPMPDPAGMAGSTVGGAGGTSAVGGAGGTSGTAAGTATGGASGTRGSSGATPPERGGCAVAPGKASSGALWGAAWVLAAAAMVRRMRRGRHRAGAR